MLFVENIFDRARKNPERVALKTQASSWTYSGLIKEINEKAEFLKESGLETGEPIGIAFPNSMEFIVTLLAAELTCHPAVLLGAVLKPREIRYHIENSGIRRILASPALANIMQEVGNGERHRNFPEIDSWIFHTQRRLSRFKEGDFICQLTSGTNGMAKAAIRTSTAVLSEIENTARALGISSDDTFLTIPPIHHSFGLIGGALTPLHSGAVLILMNGFFTADVKKYIVEEKTTVLFAVPFMYHLLNQAGEDGFEDFSSLRYCLSAGAPLSDDSAFSFKKRYGKYIYQDYGSTETGVMCLNLEKGETGKCVGKPVGDRLINVFGDDGKPLPFGLEGELRTKSTADARAYLYPDELNRQAYHEDWLTLGDYGYVMESGEVYVTGRKSNMINVAGLKVDPAEVEEIIQNVHGVKEVVVVGVPSESGGQVVKAVIVPRESGVDKKQVIQYCRENLSNFKVPRIIEFIDELPRSQTGKIIRKLLVY